MSSTSRSTSKGKHAYYLQFSSDNFVLAAGGVLFRLAPPTDSGAEPIPSPSTKPSASTAPTTASTSDTPTTPVESRPSNMSNLQICILHHKRTNDYVLPKGRKDVNESLEHAAARETFEESGYPCEPLPCPMFTRAPNPDLYTGLQPHVEPASTEPFTITFKTLKDGSGKLIFWYLMRVLSNATPRMEGTQMPNEDFDPIFVDAREGIQMLTKPDYQSVAKLAVELVENGMTRTEHRPSFNP